MHADIAHRNAVNGLHRVSSYDKKPGHWAEAIPVTREAACGFSKRIGLSEKFF